MTPTSPDQLRWELSPDLHVCLDAAENIVVEVAGKRALVPHPAMAIEALRQAKSAQIGHDILDLNGFELRTALLQLAQDVADLAETQPLDLEEASDERAALAADARRILGIPGPVSEDLEPLPPTPNGIGPAHDTDAG